jgi:hypothetical protein
MISQEKKPDVEVLGWRGCTCSVIVKPDGRTAKFSKTRLEVAYAREMHFLFSGKALVGIPAVSMPFSHSLKA